jgi:hypothetical protein
MAGSATFTTVPSRKIMLDPRMVAASTHGSARSLLYPRAARERNLGGQKWDWA